MHEKSQPSSIKTMVHAFIKTYSAIVVSYNLALMFN